MRFPVDAVVRLKHAQMNSVWDQQQQSYLSDVLTHVLDDHLVCGDGLHGEQAPLVDAAATEAQFLLAELQADGPTKKSKNVFAVQTVIR